MPMSDDKRQLFCAQLDEPVEAAKAALAPVFDGGAYDLPEDKLSLLSEVSVTLGTLRMAVIDRDLIADQVEARRQQERARRAAAVLRHVERADDRPR
jgi:hypothetical protein